MEQPGFNLGLVRPREDKCVQSLEAGGHVFDRSRPLSWLGEPEPSNLAIRIKVRCQYRLFAQHHISHPEYSGLLRWKRWALSIRFSGRTCAPSLPPSVGLLSGSILWLTVPLSSYQLLSSRRLKGRGRRGQTLLPLNRQARLWPGMGVMGQDEEGR